MMKLWLGTYAKSTTFPPSVALSVVAHALLIGAAVAGTATTNIESRELSESSIARFLTPPDREAGQLPQPEMIRYVALSVPIGAGVVLKPADEVKPIEQLAGLDRIDAPRLPELHGEDSVFSVVDVDSAATRYEWSAAPAYPPGLLEKNVQGYVRVTFVVAQDGYADTTSLQILETTDPEFTKAVRDALPFMRFKPARIGKEVVNQLVMQEFRFQITIAATDSLKTKKPIP